VDGRLVLPDGQVLGHRPAVDEWRRRVEGAGLIALFADTGPETVACYLACLSTGTPVLLADPNLRPEAVRRLTDAYEPEIVVRPPSAPEGYTSVTDRLWHRTAGVSGPVHESVALLLMTSGSTGAPRAVCLSAANVTSNAHSIAEALDITEADRAITSLPLHYSYGLSVLNSHLARDASVVLTAESPTSRRFWRCFDRTRATAFAGVPLAYEALLPVLPHSWPASLRTLTQAGGALRPDVVRAYAGLAQDRSARFFVMYGQTEATARMSVLDTGAHPEHIGSVGRAVPGGALRIDDTGGAGEVVYEGPNVMLGYAASRADLALGDRLRGVLRTGDLGVLDADGFLTLRGRIKRITKVAGRRIALDEVEQVLASAGPVAVVADGGQIAVFCAEERLGLRAAVVDMCGALGVPPGSARVHVLPELPRTSSNKIDYPRLTALITGGST